jgi:hypothetical protein
MFVNGVSGTLISMDCIVAKANSRLLPTLATLYRSQFKSYEIYGRQSGTGKEFLRIIWFPRQTVSHSLMILSTALINVDTESVVK